MKHAIFTGFPLRNAYAVNCDDGALTRAPAQQAARKPTFDLRQEDSEGREELAPSFGMGR